MWKFQNLSNRSNFSRLSPHGLVLLYKKLTRDTELWVLGEPVQLLPTLQLLSVPARLLPPLPKSDHPQNDHLRQVAIIYVWIWTYVLHTQHPSGWSLACSVKCTQSMQQSQRRSMRRPELLSESHMRKLQKIHVSVKHFLQQKVCQMCSTFFRG